MKSIHCHLDASPRAAMRLALAQELARTHGAELTVLYGVLPTLMATPWAGGEGMVAAIELMSEIDQTQRERARAVVERALARGPMRWMDSADAPLPQWLCERALYADLLVLGQYDATDTHTGALPSELVPALISDSGKPALVLPYAGSFSAQATSVVLAWKPTREAARATAAALPWLRQATQLHLAARHEDGQAAGENLAELEHWLRLHGVSATITRHSLGNAELGVGDALLSLAADVSAALLVMGCYGHSCAREWVLGGATRTVLDTMTLPVLMVH
jgi:nucleotide-binding universal stress UspA family protein